HYPTLSGIIRHYPALSGIITHFPSFPRTKKYSQHLGSALLAALLAVAAPALAQTCVPNPASYEGQTLSWYMLVDRGEVACNTTINSGGSQDIGGEAHGTVINSGGEQFVLYQGEAHGTVINSGGEQHVHQGVAHGTLIYQGGTQQVNSNGVANGTLIYQGGKQEVFESSVANGTVIYQGGIQSVFDDSGSGVANDTVISGGEQQIRTGGQVRGETKGYGLIALLSGAALVVDGGTNGLGKLTASGGTLTVNGDVSATAGSITLNLTDSTTAGSTMLAVSGAANLAGATIDITGTPPALKPNDTITLIDAGTLTLPASLALPQTMTVGAYDFNLEKDGNRLIAKVTKVPPSTITEVFDPAEGSLNCKPKPVPYGDSARCDAAPKQGYAFDTLSIAPPGNATLGTCDANGCKLTGVVGDVTVTGVFKALPPTLQPQQPQQPRQPYVISDTPTMSEVGLLLSGIALAGAAVPAIRRREKRGGKADTRQ
ncbi:MAG: AIDA repeat-containing protein, partial [Ottowia sp.]|nr:AIDA repeat-containing protein [Ottowia sp.]